MEEKPWSKRELTPKTAWILFACSFLVPPVWPIFLVIAIVVQVKANRHEQA